jgi:hypothetical protein
MGHRFLLGVVDALWFVCVLLLAAAILHTLERRAEAAEAAAGIYLGSALREFDLQHRMEGAAAYFTVAVPLAIDARSQATPMKPIKTAF